MIAPLHDPSKGILRVAGLMSGSGTNIRKIIEHQKKMGGNEKGSPFEIVVLFSDPGTAMPHKSEKNLMCRL